MLLCRNSEVKFIIHLLLLVYYILISIIFSQRKRKHCRLSMRHLFYFFFLLVTCMYMIVIVTLHIARTTTTKRRKMLDKTVCLLCTDYKGKNKRRNLYQMIFFFFVTFPHRMPPYNFVFNSFFSFFSSLHLRMTKQTVIRIIIINKNCSAYTYVCIEKSWATYNHSYPVLNKNADWLFFCFSFSFIEVTCEGFLFHPHADIRVKSCKSIIITTKVTHTHPYTYCSIISFK